MTVIAAPAVAADAAFARALATEVLASERMRARVLAAVLAVLLVADQLLFVFAHDMFERLAGKPVPVVLPLMVIGPFVAYEAVVLLALRHLSPRKRGLPAIARYATAAVETSLPTALLWSANNYAGFEIALGTWPYILYFLFIVASTLRLDFMLPAFTGGVAACSYLGFAYAVLPSEVLHEQRVLLTLWPKAGIMLLGGVVSGLVAVRLRTKFRHAAEQTALRERVTNLFGQHVSPAVVERLLASPADFPGESREICVMFLDIRDFTAHGRGRRPEDIVEYLNNAFAFMIDAVDRHGGFINKFLGDGFMAMFGAPLADSAAVRNAMMAARDILGEIDRRRLATASWPLRVGIGLHVGPAVTGNVGSPRRKEFTAIGDTVNLASRLEQLTKEHDARLVVSDAVISALGNESNGAVRLGDVIIKGYGAPVPVWRLA